MKFSTREDVEAPVDYVFGQVSDFGAFERQALRRGADVRRIFRGKDRQMRGTLSIYDAPNMVQIDVASPNIEGVALIELVPLSPHRTRIVVSIEIGAKTLAARLMLQSLKLAKSNLTNRFKKRVADFAMDIEDRFKTGA